ncbi:DMT family transporter [Mesorhizobium sp. ORS 3428]|uniref:DMT family transporter n=1 Tax=Mesorhizobium sp. ORS 3428 TaxID=540997 RepID=UPI0008DAE249|nr:DMT family transporter [Mesorhizobium sp. ORS 3428]OHV87399.1 hypothetical protein ORS3428_21975 [Mesorhizobium sp. ORS 3428]
MRDGGEATDNNWTTNAKLVTGMALFGSATPISKIITSAMPVFVGSMLRMAIGVLVLFPFIARGWHDVAKLSRRDWFVVTVIALFGMFGFSVLMLSGIGMVAGAVGATVMSTTPAVTSAASIVLLKEKPTCA